jgi:hypothetical protein
MTDSRNSRLATPATGVSKRVRAFVDAEGTRWQVYEQAFAEYDRRRGMSLIFASDSAMRRVRAYPGDWYELSDTELLTLSWKS